MYKLLIITTYFGSCGVAVSQTVVELNSKERNMFERATRIGLRFQSVAGFLSVEDLWWLPLNTENGKASFYNVARGIHSRLQAIENASFVEDDSQKDELETLCMDIVKHIIKVIQEEQKAEIKKRESKVRRQKLLEIIEKKEEEGLMGASIEDLRKMVEGL